MCHCPTVPRRSQAELPRAGSAAAVVLEAAGAAAGGWEEEGLEAEGWEAGGSEAAEGREVEG